MAEASRGWEESRLCPDYPPSHPLLPCQMSVFLYILAARASCAAQRQGFEKKGPV